jgi:siroheme synthase (precorrin-2 oxidase/ferrochelatase)
LRLEGRVAIVVGASGEIGSATTRAFARAGMHVVLAAPASEIHLWSAWPLSMHSNRSTFWPTLPASVPIRRSATTPMPISNARAAGEQARTQP